MGRNTYISLSIPRERYNKLRREFDSVIKTDDGFSYTEWHTTLAEAGIERAKFIRKNHPHLKVVKKIPKGIIIDDSKKQDVIKVYNHDGKISCSYKGKEAFDYIIFACLSPEFNPGF